MFPAPSDTWNQPRVEHGLLLLARRCGLQVAESRLTRVGDADGLLVKRFDRVWSEGGCRRHRMASGGRDPTRPGDGLWPGGPQLGSLPARGRGESRRLSTAQPRLPLPGAGAGSGGEGLMRPSARATTEGECGAGRAPGEIEGHAAAHAVIESTRQLNRAADLPHAPAEALLPLDGIAQGDHPTGAGGRPQGAQSLRADSRAESREHGHASLSSPAPVKGRTLALACFLKTPPE